MACWGEGLYLEPCIMTRMNYTFKADHKLHSSKPHPPLFLSIPPFTPAVGGSVQCYRKQQARLKWLRQGPVKGSYRSCQSAVRAICQSGCMGQPLTAPQRVGMDAYLCGRKAANGGSAAEGSVLHWVTHYSLSLSLSVCVYVRIGFLKASPNSSVSHSST